MTTHRVGSAVELVQSLSSASLCSCTRSWSGIDCSVRFESVSWVVLSLVGGVSPEPAFTPILYPIIQMADQYPPVELLLQASKQSPEALFSRMLRRLIQKVVLGLHVPSDRYHVSCILFIEAIEGKAIPAFRKPRTVLRIVLVEF